MNLHKFAVCSALLVLGCCPSQSMAQCDRASLTTVSGRSAPGGKICPGQLVFQDSFDNINRNTWDYEQNLGNANGEFQWYTDSSRNSFTKNGNLVIQPTLTRDLVPDLTSCHIVVPNCNGNCERVCDANNIAPPVQSARMTSINGFAFKYGRVEISAKLPTGDWLWPALWLMPKTSAYGGWPRSGEIDLMEARGNWNMVDNNGRQIGVEQFASTLHFGTNGGNSAWYTAHMEKNTPAGQGLNRGFHLYQMEWTPDHINFSLDNQFIGSIETGDGFFKRGGFGGNDNPWATGAKNAPFDKEFYFIFNLAVGGTNGFFPDQGNAGGKPWQNGAQFAARDFWNGRQQWFDSWNWNTDAQFSSALQVDYVKVFAL